MEKDLFLPIKEYFEQFGYSCDGEVNDIDLYMEKGEENVAVELKEKLDFKAVQQAALRQKTVDRVFIGIFKPRDLFSSSFKDKVYLLKRLGIGLILVSKRSFTVEIFSEPEVTELAAFVSHNKGARKALSEEFRKRKVKVTTGGVKGTKLITGYREEALSVLDALMELGGEGTAKDVREISKVPKSRNIMYDNHYGWFEPVSRGKYKVSEAGLCALEEFEYVLSAMNKRR